MNYTTETVSKLGTSLCNVRVRRALRTRSERRDVRVPFVNECRCRPDELWFPQGNDQHLPHDPTSIPRQFASRSPSQRTEICRDSL